jgi:FAD-linked oxidoreductase
MIDALIKNMAAKGQKWSNWTGNVECYAEQIFYPHTEQQIVDIVLRAKKEAKNIRVVGNAHSFSNLVETNSFIVSLRAYNGLISVDKDNMTATIKAGTSIKNANEALFKHDLAMINLGDIDVQSVAGATATGTHGTGIGFGNVSTEIVDFTIITANGEILNCSENENSEIFQAGRVALGALGIITQITFNVDKAYKLEYISSSADFTETLSKLDEYNSNNRNFEFYYFPFADTVQLKESNKTDKPVKYNKVLGYVNDVVIENFAMQTICNIATTFPSTFKRLNRFMANNCTKETKINYSHKIYATVRNVRFKEMEYNIPLENFEDCICKLKSMIEENEYYIFFPVECRFVKGDDIWLSPAYGRDSAYIAVHVYSKSDHDPYFEEMEKMFCSFGGRPHWGKMHTRKADYLSQSYEKWNDFLTLRERLDPEKRFINPHLQGVFGII